MSIGLRICDVEAVDGWSSSSDCTATPPDVIIRPVSFAAIAAFSFVLVIPDTHLPVSKCCNCADGQLNCFLHLASATHLMSLSGLCRTDVRCCSSAFLSIKILSHFLHFVPFFFLFLVHPFPSPCILPRRWSTSAQPLLKSRSQSQHRNCVTEDGVIERTGACNCMCSACSCLVEEKMSHL